MEKEIRLVKTCVGLVSEYSVLCLADRAIEIALETDITYEEALTVLLKLASVGIDIWLHSSYGYYLDFDEKYDYFTSFKWTDETEIVCSYNDDYNVVYSVEKKKFYKEYATSKYGDELIKEEIDL